MIATPTTAARYCRGSRGLFGWWRANLSCHFCRGGPSDRILPWILYGSGLRAGFHYAETRCHPSRRKLCSLSSHEKTGQIILNLCSADILCSPASFTSYILDNRFRTWININHRSIYIRKGDRLCPRMAIVALLFYKNRGDIQLYRARYYSTVWQSWQTYDSHQHTD